MKVQDATVPSRGDLVVQHRTGIPGYVWYADQLQVLVKCGKTAPRAACASAATGSPYGPAEQEGGKEERAAPPLVECPSHS
jgi:hypothetical protein